MKQVMLDPEACLTMLAPSSPPWVGSRLSSPASFLPHLVLHHLPPRRERAAPLEALFSLSHQRETDLGRVEPECQIKTAASSSAPVGPALGLVTSAY